MKSFWIVNTSNRLVSLGDVGVCLQPYQSINLLDSIHYPHLTEDHIYDSLKSGSLYKRSNIIKVRKVLPPQILKGPSKIGLNEEPNFPSKIRSLLEHKEEKYEELDLPNEKNIEENAEFAEIDDVGKFKRG